MTETHRQISNEEILSNVDQQVTRVESELSRLDELQKNLRVSRDTVGKLSLENKRIRENVDGLEKSKRVTKLQSNAASISLEENDALIERSIAAARELLPPSARPPSHPAPKSCGRYRRSVDPMLGRRLNRYWIFPCSAPLARTWNLAPDRFWN